MGNQRFIYNSQSVAFGSYYLRGVTLRIEFPKYIRVSSSYYSYTILELLAEVGGYFGLFLGVSIIQISGLMEILMAKLDQYVKNWRENSP